MKDHYFQIEGWARNYETTESRKLKHLKWVALQNSFDGKLYKKLLKQPDPIRVFGVAVLMAELASRAPADHRGKLIGSELSTGYSPDDMADKTGMPLEDFLFAIPILISIGWITFRDKSGKISEISENLLIHNITLHNITTKDIPADAGSDKPTLADLVPLNLPPADHPGALGLLKAAPKLSTFPLDKEGYPEACLDIIRGMIALHKKHGGAVNLLKALNYYLKDAASPLLICAAVRRLNAMPEPPKSWYAYWKSIMGNPEILRREWEEKIWPVVKSGGVKWQ